MRFRGGGVGHTSTRTATDRFLQDRDQLDRDNSLTQGLAGNESEDGFDGSDIDEAVDEEGGGDNDWESEHIQGNQDGNGGDKGEGLGGGDGELGTGDVDDEGGIGNEEEDYGYRYLGDEESEEEDSGDEEPLDVADDALGPEDGEGDDDDVNLLGFAAF